MNVFEHAMQMELDGKKYYEESAEKVDLPQLKQVLMELASDENKHYNLFKAMRDNALDKYGEIVKSEVFDNTKNIFTNMISDDKDLSFSDDIIKIWEQASKIEKEAELFYKNKAEEVDDPKKKELLLQIAKEENHHWKTIDNIVNFLKRPANWIEDAEWRNFEEY